MPDIILRQNGKPSLTAIHEIARLYGVPMAELEETAHKYRPALERMGLLDGLAAYQEVMLFVWLWRHDKGGNAEVVYE